MEIAKSVATLIVLVLSAVVPIILHTRRIKRWNTELNACFQGALKNLNINTYECLVDRIVPPTLGRTPEVYRIFHDQDENYFLYIKIEDTPGVLKSLTKERAHLAAETSGYGR